MIPTFRFSLLAFLTAVASWIGGEGFPLRPKLKAANHALGLHDGNMLPILK